MSKVDLLDHLGSDLTIVNAARVSMDKFHTHFEEGKDDRLISYLARHNHFTPFCHCFLQFRITTPIFVARQLFKHQIGLTANEVSRRYVDDTPDFYVPKMWRARAENVKQGSSPAPVKHSGNITAAYYDFLARAEEFYEDLINEGVAPEMARMVLPQSAYTSWIWSGSLYAFARVCNLRLDSHAQAETREVAEQIYKHMLDLFPVSTKALVNVRTD